MDFVLDTDASGDGLGAVLSQMTNGEERVLAYASRALSRSERKYCATRREMLALVWAARHFRPYLYGKKFVLRTDHHSLQWLHKFKEPEGQVARWLEVLFEFDYTVVHRAGKRHTYAAALSRGRCSQCGLEEEEEDETLPCDAVSHLMLPAWTEEEIKAQQSQFVSNYQPKERNDVYIYNCNIPFDMPFKSFQLFVRFISCIKLSRYIIRVEYIAEWLA